MVLKSPALEARVRRPPLRANCPPAMPQARFGCDRGPSFCGSRSARSCRDKGEIVRCSRCSGARSLATKNSRGGRDPRFDHAARPWYSWMRPPSTSRPRKSRGLTGIGSRLLQAVGRGRGRDGAPCSGPRERVPRRSGRSASTGEVARDGRRSMPGRGNINAKGANIKIAPTTRTSSSATPRASVRGRFGRGDPRPVPLERSDIAPGDDDHGRFRLRTSSQQARP